MPVWTSARNHGGPGENRTPDTAIFSRMLYQLSYRAMRARNLARPREPGYGAIGAAALLRGEGVGLAAGAGSSSDRALLTTTFVRGRSGGP